jgi:ribonuclease HI
MSDAALTINIDGAARGNPGPASFAYVIAADGRPPIEFGSRLGDTTNNVAEYTALVRALERAAELGAKRLLIRSDSELLVKQMNGQYKVKNEQLRELFDKAQSLSRRFDVVTIRHVRREENKEADRLCNEALDGKKGGGAAPKKEKKSPGRADAVREDAVACLEAAAAAWRRGESVSAAVVWEQLWSILEENGALRK